MTPVLTCLLIAGLLFPMISLLSGAGSLLHPWRHKSYASPVFIPFVGPLLLTIWVISAHKPLGLIALAWVCDIGTVAFLAAGPRLVKDWWHTSGLTRIAALNGSQDDQRAIITLHSTGHYKLKKSWTRPPGQVGIVGLGESGTFVQSGAHYTLTSHVGVRRILRKINEGAYRVEAEELEELRNHSLKGWVLKS